MPAEASAISVRADHTPAGAPPPAPSRTAHTPASPAAFVPLTVTLWSSSKNADSPFTVASDCVHATGADHAPVAARVTA